ncbi:capsular biosynthesis protein [Halalkalibacillus sediminis]|uniref:non-specific protein-tyrosine kinase n=1 Tax=Halalkalibacillus sediminis TaxID=2018042 RepID=A0A2I0QU02_9BACI|nr:CpsD/CapB family tyrosine-protein kinase [Halalkalibacillus sediminis]PKR77821.1 capsular biosynthesis protein [Halalkalibacillus sediminis]
MFGKRKKKNVKRTLIAKDQPKSPISEQFRTLRTNLQFASVDNELRSMIVTSTAPEEGKSITSANLAIVYAQQGLKVLFVDADLRKPTMHYTFRLSNTSGLSSLLIGKQSLDEVVEHDHIANLDLLPSGPIPPNPSELIGSRRMSRFIEEATKTYDLVLFDTPPVVAVTDAQLLANYVDGALLVIRSGQTNKQVAVKAKELLDQANANILGTVLNDVEVKKDNYYYYYGR